MAKFLSAIFVLCFLGLHIQSSLGSDDESVAADLKRLEREAKAAVQTANKNVFDTVEHAAVNLQNVEDTLKNLEELLYGPVPVPKPPKPHHHGNDHDHDHDHDHGHDHNHDHKPHDQASSEQSTDDQEDQASNA